MSSKKPVREIVGEEIWGKTGICWKNDKAALRGDKEQDSLTTKLRRAEESLLFRTVKGRDGEKKDPTTPHACRVKRGSTPERDQHLRSTARGHGPAKTAL